jgi:hypothetical protein
VLIKPSRKLIIDHNVPSARFVLTFLHARAPLPLCITVNSQQLNQMAPKRKAESAAAAAAAESEVDADGDIKITDGSEGGGGPAAEKKARTTQTPTGAPAVDGVVGGGGGDGRGGGAGTGGSIRASGPLSSAVDDEKTTDVPMGGTGHSSASAASASASAAASASASASSSPSSVPAAGPVASAALSYLIIGALSQEAPQTAAQAAALQHFFDSGIGIDGSLTTGKTLTVRKVTADLKDLWSTPQSNGGFVVCYVGHCGDNGGLRLKGAGDTSQTVMPVQLYNLWSASAAFKAGGSLFLLLYCCYSGVWVDVARDMARERKCERVFVQSSAPSTTTAFDGVFGELWIEYAVGRMSAVKLRNRLPALPASYAPGRSASAAAAPSSPPTMSAAVLSLVCLKNAMVLLCAHSSSIAMDADSSVSVGLLPAGYGAPTATPVVQAAAEGARLEAKRAAVAAEDARDRITGKKVLTDQELAGSSIRQRVDARSE